MSGVSPITSGHDHSGPGSSGSVKYSTSGKRIVTRYPGGTSSIPVYCLRYEDVRFSHEVFDNLSVSRKESDPPFYLGVISRDELPEMEFEMIALEVSNSPEVKCHSNLNYHENAKGKKTSGTRKRPGHFTHKKGGKAPQEKSVPSPTLVQTNIKVCNSRTITDSPAARNCSHYSLSEMKQGNESRIMQTFGLQKWKKIAGILPWLNPDWQCVSSVGLIVSEMGHVLGFHRENNLYCSVNLLLTGKKRWTFIHHASNDYFQTVCCKLVKEKNLTGNVAKCHDPAQHKQFAVFFDENDTSVTRYVVEQNASEVIFVPPSIFHQVEVLEPSVCVAFNVADSEWTTLKPGEFDSQCQHYPLEQFGAMERQRAGYYVLNHYAKNVDPSFLQKTDLHPDEKCVEAFEEKMRVEAIRAELLPEGPLAKRPRVATDTTHEHEMGKRQSAKGDCQSLLPNTTDAEALPNYNPDDGAEYGKVYAVMEATFKCERVGCEKYFITSHHAKYHCRKDEIRCQFCGAEMSNPFRKQSHENACKENPEVIKKLEDAAASKRAMEEEEIKERRRAANLTEEVSSAGTKMAPCKFCKILFALGSGFKRHEDYCPQNPHRKIRAAKGSMKGLPRRRNIPPSTAATSEHSNSGNEA